MSFCSLIWGGGAGQPPVETQFATFEQHQYHPFDEAITYGADGDGHRRQSQSQGQGQPTAFPRQHPFDRYSLDPLPGVRYTRPWLS